MPKPLIAAGLDEMRSLKDDWEPLHQRGGGGLFQSFAWMEAWATVIDGQGRDDIRIQVVEDGGMRLILPLVVRRHLGIRRLRWLGIEVTDHCDAIGADDASTHELAGLVCANLPPADLVELRQIRSDSLARKLFAADLVPGREAESCPTITVATAKPPKDILYAERRARSLGSLAHIVAGSRAERAEIVDFVIRHKRQWLLGQGKQTDEFDNRVSPFLRCLPSLAFPPAAKPYFSRLLLDGETIAAQIGFVEGRRLFYYLPAFDVAFRNCSPGHLLLLNLLRDAAGAGLESVDLLRGMEPYKRKWTGTVEPSLALQSTPTWRGRAYVAARTARQRLQGRSSRPDDRRLADQA